jgi:ABC-type branched-subunit amino acid transport system ATPase component
MLRLEHISVAYGKHEALHDVSLDVEAGRTTVILGANGAGKTTLLKTIAGLVRPRPGGRILFEGRPIEAEPTHRMVAAGIALVPEGRRLFGDMTVLDNLRMGAYTKHARAAAEHRLESLLALFPRLAERRGQLARTMSGGEQQMLAIARALMSGPKLILLDEPSLGLGPRLVKDLFASLHTIREHGQSVVLVEQNVRQSLRLADYVYVLENGRIVRSGTTAEMEADAAIQKAYLGLASKAPATPPRPPKEPVQSIPGGIYSSVGRIHSAGGFVNPFSRSVAPAHCDSSPHEKEQPMERQMDFATAGSGFFHPFARSIAPPRPVASPRPVAAKAESVHPQVVRTDSAPHPIPTSGGFVNPHARSARQ